MIQNDGHEENFRYIRFSLAVKAEFFIQRSSLKREKTDRSI